MTQIIREFEKDLKEVLPLLSPEDRKYYSSRLEMMRNPFDDQQFWMYEGLIRHVINLHKKEKS